MERNITEKNKSVVPRTTGSKQRKDGHWNVFKGKALRDFNLVVIVNSLIANENRNIQYIFKL
jgi:hypothetical protein